jgi:sphingolipid delta-4 desaturase
MFIYNLPVTPIQLANIAAQLLFDWALVRFFSWNSLIYLLLSSFLAGSLHPCAGHFISEHYVFSRARGSRSKPTPHDPAIPLPETYSYYGPLNVLIYNVGLHNEHHDFPAVPWTRLPVLHKIAREFYEDLPQHTSLVSVLWRFVRDENVGLWCRVKRAKGGRLVGGGWKEEELGSNVGTGLEKEGVR